ncbi:restriction endonuclease subunit S [Vibrio lentus]
MGSIKPTKTKRGCFGKVATSLNKKLENVEWGEFLIGALFEKVNLKFKRANFNKDIDISKVRNDEFNLPLVNAKDGENGIMYYGRDKDFESTAYSIDIVNDGAVSTGNVYSQPQKTGVLYNAYLIKLKDINDNDINSKVLHFLTTAIFKSIKLKFGYENKAGWAKVQQENILLPTKQEKPDFEFMENFIAELEAERIAELEAYLEVTGLSDCELTEDEQKALDDFTNDDVEWREFNLKDLFGAATRGKRLKSSDRIKGKIPFVTAGETNQGVSALIGNDVTIFSKNTVTIDMFGSAKYRNHSYGADDHVAVVHTEKLDKFASIFVTTSAHKVANAGQFDYGRNFYAKDADALNIQLPTKTKSIKPNYSTMELLISAIQKIVIKDVVEYADTKIQAHKEVVLN